MTPPTPPSLLLPPAVRRVRRRLFGDRGQVTGWVAVTAVAVILMAGIVLDGGLAVAARVRAFDVAQAAARAGAAQLDVTLLRTRGVLQLDPAQAQAAARQFLTRADAAGTVTATTTAVTVTVTAAQRTQLLRVIGISQLPVAATASATPITPPPP